VYSTTSDRLDFVSFHANRERSLDRVYGNDERTVSISRNEDALQAVQHAAPDSHALTNLEKGMRGPRQLSFYQTPNCVDLFVGNRGALSLGAHEAKYSVHTQNTQPVRSSGLEFREYVTTKKRHLDGLFAIAPSVHFGDEWEEGGHAPLLEALSHNLFVPGSGLEPVPALGFDLWKRLRKI